MNNYEIQFSRDKRKYIGVASFICPINVTVIVETDKGLQFGKIVGRINENSTYALKILRISTKSDYNHYLDNLKLAKEATLFAYACIKKLNLNMHIIDASFNFDRKQLLINFIADERIDFRELAKELAAKFKTRIELRQIGARDKAKKCGGIGICGRILCCSSFLTNIQPISMNMAKNQNIALNPSKINGCCGRLLCCLKYEDDEYLKCLSIMPNINDIVNTKHGKGYVISIDILNRKYKVNVNNEFIEIELNNSESSKK